MRRALSFVLVLLALQGVRGVTALAQSGADGAEGREIGARDSPRAARLDALAKAYRDARRFADAARAFTEQTV